LETVIAKVAAALRRQYKIL